MIRCIGNPDLRFVEDPVRMVRAVRLASRLKFDIEPATYDGICRHCGEIVKAAPQRLLEELYRLFGFGSGEAAFRLLRKTGLMSFMLPEVEACMDRDEASGDRVWSCLGAVDRMGPAGSAYAPAQQVMLGALLYVPFLERRDGKAQRPDGAPASGFDIAVNLLRPLARRYQLPKAVFWRLCHAFDLQRRLEEAWTNAPGASPRQTRPERLAALESFPDALALFEMWAAAGHVDRVTVEKWRGMAEQRATPTREFEKHSRRRPRRRHKRTPPPQTSPGHADASSRHGPAEKKKRWRFHGKFPFITR